MARIEPDRRHTPPSSLAYQHAPPTAYALRRAASWRPRLVTTDCGQAEAWAVNTVFNRCEPGLAALRLEHAHFVFGGQLPAKIKLVPHMWDTSHTSAALVAYCRKFIKGGCVRAVL